jgi:hypothetical protein
MKPYTACQHIQIDSREYASSYHINIRVEKMSLFLQLQSIRFDMLYRKKQSHPIAIFPMRFTLHFAKCYPWIDIRRGHDDRRESGEVMSNLLSSCNSTS